MESGYKFQPSDELILRLLKEKRLNPHFSHHPIKDIDHICSLEPWDLPTESKTESEDQVFYFFYEPRYKYRNSNRVDRRTEAGQWKITSKDSQIEAGNGLTGTKKFLTFYCRGPDSKVPVKTDWVVHEYHAKDDPRYEKEFVLCCITNGEASAYVDDGSETNTADNDAWVEERSTKAHANWVWDVTGGNSVQCTKLLLAVWKYGCNS
ncbi:hypothetical protein KPL70_021539 [Citrus sinensis]|nr:hypothetical protein KPL70_021539 [Citrus sinensis]